MNYVKRAIIMAAGYGSRMYPLTKTIPKPLISVNGIRMIDSIIDALHQNDICEIYVVVGYMKEQFYEWADAHKHVKIIENPYYKECNNISSLYVAREYIEDAIIIDGDQMIYNPKVLFREFTNAGYNVVWQEDFTKEWILQLDDGIVTSCSRDGGQKGYRLYGISRWTSADGIKLKNHLEREFITKKHTDIYWDDVALFCYPDEYRLGVYEMNYNDVVEIDSIDELIAIDGSYER